MHRWRRFEALVLAFWGLLWGLLFGAILNVWFWPFVFQAQSAELYWQPGTGVIEAVKRYLAFYMITSFWWDAGRAVGNALLIGLFGVPLLKLFRRFQKRFRFQYREPTDRSRPKRSFPLGQRGFGNPNA
jgi:energy-coupling factor transport system substrate-specific component